jgi:hypothetical protein
LREGYTNFAKQKASVHQHLNALELEGNKLQEEVRILLICRRALFFSLAQNATMADQIDVLQKIADEHAVY